MYGLLLYRKEDALHNRFFVDRLIMYAKRAGLGLELSIQEDWPDAQGEESISEEKTGKEELSQFGKTIMDRKPDFVINRTRDYHIVQFLEKMGIRVFNNAQVTRLGNDKWEMYEYVRTHTDILQADTALWQSFSRNTAEYLDGLKGEWVIKSLSGHGGSEVFCYPMQDVFTIQQGLGKKPCIIQPRILGQPRDVRIYMLGNRVYAAMQRSGKKGDFRANLSLGGECGKYQLPEKMKRQAVELSELLKPDFASMDFILDGDGNWYFNEMEDMVGSRMLYRQTDKDVAKDYIRYIAEQLKRG